MKLSGLNEIRNWKHSPVTEITGFQITQDWRRMLQCKNPEKVLDRNKLQSWIDKFHKELKELRSDPNVSYRAGFRAPLSVEPWEAEVLFLSVLKVKPEYCVEFGGGQGLSSLHIGKALSILGRGVLLTYESNLEHCIALEENVKKAQLSSYIQRLQLDCSKIENLEGIGTVDFAFIDRNADVQGTHEDLKRLSEKGCRKFFLHDTVSRLYGSTYTIINGIQWFMWREAGWNLSFLTGEMPEELTSEFPDRTKVHPVGYETMAFLEFDENYQQKKDVIRTPRLISQAEQEYTNKIQGREIYYVIDESGTGLVPVSSVSSKD